MPPHRKKVFVLGTGRSGTCWLGDILGQHPEVRSYVEVQPLFAWVTQAAINVRAEKILLPKIFAEYQRLFQNAAPWHFADKSHPGIWIAEKLAERFPDACFLGVTRDVEPTVASMLRHTGVRRWCEEWNRYEVPNRFLGITEWNLEWYRRASILERCVARWLAHQNELLRLQHVLSDRFLLIKYELLVVQTQAVLTRLKQFLNLDANFPAITPVTNSLTKWEAQLSPAEIASIRSALDTLMDGNSSQNVLGQPAEGRELQLGR